MDWQYFWVDVLISAAATAVTGYIAWQKHTLAEQLGSSIPYPVETKGSRGSSPGPSAKLANAPSGTSPPPAPVSDLEGKLVRVEGVVVPVSASAFLSTPISCVANLHTTVRHSARYDPIFRTWSSDSTQILRVAQQLPFYLARPGSGLFQANLPVVGISGIDMDMESAGLELPVISSSFAPSPPPTIGQLAFDVIQGERVLGYETTERALPVGTRITAVGILDFSKKIVAQGVKGWAGAGAAVVPTTSGEDSVPMLVEKEGMPFLVGFGCSGFAKLLFICPLFISSSRHHPSVPIFPLFGLQHYTIKL
jgi:hypothetical protein